MTIIMSEWIYDAVGDCRDRIAVLDIGSNSVRLVVYDRLERIPISLFNEKALCGLGRNLEQDGHLHPNGRAEALAALQRFAILLKAMNVEQILPMATASLRDATDGPDFIREVAEKTGLKIQIVSGEEEARLSGLGVISAMPNLSGVVGDLGGGSLELIGVGQSMVKDRVSLPIGPQRLQRPKLSAAEVAKTIGRALGSADWLGQYRGQDFVAVGGAWRALARLHIEQTHHPLNIVHHYTLSLDAALNFMTLMAQQSPLSIEKMSGFSRRRAESLPLTALILVNILERLQPTNLVFSAYGLREGVLFDLLSPDQRHQDPLIRGCQVIAERNQRFATLVDDLMMWTAPVFRRETPEWARLRLACCLLSDFCWAEHPEYRAKHAFLRVLRLPIVGVTHADRMFLALVSLYRYGGQEDRETDSMTNLLSPHEKEWARLLGAALRLGLSLSGGATRLLHESRLIWNNQGLQLEITGRANLVTEVLDKKITNLGHVSAKLKGA